MSLIEACLKSLFIFPHISSHLVSNTYCPPHIYQQELTKTTEAHKTVQTTISRITIKMTSLRLNSAALMKAGFITVLLN